MSKCAKNSSGWKNTAASRQTTDRELKQACHPEEGALCPTKDPMPSTQRHRPQEEFPRRTHVGTAAPAVQRPRSIGPQRAGRYQQTPVMLSAAVTIREANRHCEVEASLPSPRSIHGYHSAAKSFHCGLRRSNKAIFFARDHPFSCFSRPSALCTSS